MTSDFYSLRMRATGNGRHLSGAERIVGCEDVTAVATQLIARAMQKRACSPDDVQCSIERLDPAGISYLPLPEVSTWEVTDCATGRKLAASLLTRAGVAPESVATTIETLAHGAAPGGGVMRGAMIVDAQSGERLEKDRSRGVRVSRMDLAPGSRKQIEATLTAAGLGHHRVVEALVLAGKALKASGMVAELCWSDSPDYVTGYIADQHLGYQRINRLKECGEHFGGRAFFVDRQLWRQDEFINWLERRPVLFESLSVVHPPRHWSE